ncbi:MAG: FIST C-terminal domain-containing protein [Treponema sp.]|jgi:hypothetical protein|nr:FIST C-terminal domain-containing protein [Treponema sp.]
MIESIIVQTAEVDDADSAVSGILAQLAGKTLRKNSVGIVSCFADFISSGILAALAEKLPFPLVGTTTLAAAASGGIQGQVLLVITVLTSDEVEFAAGVTDPVTGEDDTPFRAAWEKTGARRNDKPALMLSFAPLLLNVPADFFAEAWSGITGNVPNFGTLAVDHHPDYHESQTILNGEGFRDRYVFVFCYGKLEPRFFIGGISEEKAFREKGVVTSSRGNQLKAVNGVSVAEYLSSLGMERDESGAITGINAFPFIQDYKDGTQPVIRVMFAITPDGSAVCGGKIPEGAELSVGFISAEVVLKYTDEALRTALAETGAKTRGKTFLVFSCVGRFFAMGYNSSAEMDKIAGILAEVPFHLSYSGTELCPVHGKDGKLINRSHNDTIVICVL